MWILSKKLFKTASIAIILVISISTQVYAIEVSSHVIKKFEQKDDHMIFVEKLNGMEVGESTISGVVSRHVERVYIHLNRSLVRYRLVENDNSFFGHVSNNLQAGDIITVIPQDRFGNFGEAKTIKVQAAPKLDAPKIEAYIEGQEKITGRVAEGTKYVRIYVNGKFLRKREVETDGRSLIAHVLDAKPLVGDTITIVPYSNKNAAGTVTNVTVDVTINSNMLQIEEYVKGDERLIGKTSNLADKIDLYINNNFVRTRDIDKMTGDFFISTRSENKLPDIGDTLTIISRMNNGQIISRNTTDVKAFADVEKPKVEIFKEGDLRLKGHVSKDIKKVRVYYGPSFSQMINRGLIDQDGNFVTYVNDLKFTKRNIIRVLGVLENNRESRYTELEVQ